MHDQPTSDVVAGCVFCDRATLDGILTTTDHFFLLADHAPLVAGHLLLIPRAHAACYGATPSAYDAELLMLKRRIRAFLRSHYHTPAFFEHGAYHQTVYHAHLHAFPFDKPLHLATLAETAGAPVASLADLRAWYTERGPYFYLEEPLPTDAPIRDRSATSLTPNTPNMPNTPDFGPAWVFPPNDMLYLRALNHMRAATGAGATWQPPALRRVTGRPSVEALIAAWRRWERDEHAQ